jgi:predicted kinase
MSEEKRRPIFLMMVGLPASGKSTLVDILKGPNDVVLSTDNWLENYAKNIGRTYNDVFTKMPEAFKAAEMHMGYDLQDAIARGSDIVWDQTNLYPKTRKAKLAKIPKHYEKICINVVTPDPDEWERRLRSRPGKIIPQHVLDSMSKSLVYATPEEGFDVVFTVDPSSMLIGSSEET